MTEKKLVFILPGYKHNPKSTSYRKIAVILKNKGYTPVPVKIPWKKRTITQNTDYFIKKFKKKLNFYKHTIKKKYILGFSFGAMIAFVASTKVSVSGLILCSLSPYFKEDLGKTKKMSLTSLERQRYLDFSKLHCKKLAKKIKAKKVHVLYGTKEPLSLKKRAALAYSQIPVSNKFLLPIKNTEHNIRDSRYLNKIKEIAGQLG